MTKDDAIKTLRQIKGFFRNNRVNESVDMAIGALLERDFGEWVQVSEPLEHIQTYRCNLCGEEYRFPNGTPKENGCNYCPSCGAEMGIVKKAPPAEAENAMVVELEEEQ